MGLVPSLEAKHPPVFGRASPHPTILIIYFHQRLKSRLEKPSPAEAGHSSLKGIGLSQKTKGLDTIITSHRLEIKLNHFSTMNKQLSEHNLIDLVQRFGTGSQFLSRQTIERCIRQVIQIKERTLFGIDIDQSSN
jgi:hypothetical protein